MREAFRILTMSLYGPSQAGIRGLAFDMIDIWVIGGAGDGCVGLKFS